MNTLHLLIVQGPMGVPGFPGTDGVPVSKADTQLIIHTHRILSYITVPLFFNEMCRHHWHHVVIVLLSLSLNIFTSSFSFPLWTWTSSGIETFSITLSIWDLSHYNRNKCLSAISTVGSWRLHHPVLSVGSPWAGGWQRITRTWRL